MNYKWLDKKLEIPKVEFDGTTKVLDYLDASDFSIGKRNLIAKYFFYEIERYEKEGRLDEFKIHNLSKSIQSWQKTKVFKKMKENITEQTSKFNMDSLISYSAFYFIVFYMKELIRGTDFLSWWLLTLIIGLSFFFLFRNYREKYFYLVRYGLEKPIIPIDLCIAVIVIVGEILVTVPFDPIIFVLVIAYFLTKNRAEKHLEKFDKKVDK